MFVESEAFPQQTFYPVAVHGFPDSASGDEPHPPEFRARRVRININEKRRMYQPPARFQNLLEILL
jgi:hypothetical protein